MIVNVRLEVDDEARQALASLLAGKPVKRLAGRKEVCEVVGGIIAGLKAVPPENREGVPEQARSMDELARRRGGRSLKEPDPEDAEELAGKSASYVTGWNKVKYALCSKA